MRLYAEGRGFLVVRLKIAFVANAIFVLLFSGVAVSVTADPAVPDDNSCCYML